MGREGGGPALSEARGRGLALARSEARRPSKSRLEGRGGDENGSERLPDDFEKGAGGG